MPQNNEFQSQIGTTGNVGIHSLWIICSITGKAGESAPYAARRHSCARHIPASQPECVHLQGHKCSSFCCSNICAQYSPLPTQNHNHKHKPKHKHRQTLTKHKHICVQMYKQEANTIVLPLKKKKKTCNTNEAHEKLSALDVLLTFPDSPTGTGRQDEHQKKKQGQPQSSPHIEELPPLTLLAKCEPLDFSGAFFK